jgi:hypothetical protein
MLTASLVNKNFPDATLRISQGCWPPNGAKDRRLDAGKLPRPGDRVDGATKNAAAPYPMIAGGAKLPV